MDYPRGTTDADISDRFACSREEEDADYRLEEAERKYLAGVALMRGTFRAILTVGQVPSPGARDMYLRSESAIDALWRDYQAALEAWMEASQ